MARDALERPSRCGGESQGKPKSREGTPAAVSPPGSSEAPGQEEIASSVELASKRCYVHRRQSVGVFFEKKKKK